MRQPTLSCFTYLHLNADKNLRVQHVAIARAKMGTNNESIALCPLCSVEILIKLK